MENALGWAAILTCSLLAAPLGATPPEPTEEPVRCDPPAPPRSRPSTALRLLGGAEHHRPLLRFQLGERCMSLEVPLSTSHRVEAISGFPVDRALHEYRPGVSYLPRFRVGARFDTGLQLAPFNLHAAYEHDLPTGTVAGDADLAGTGYPAQEGIDHELRQAYVRASIGRWLHVSAGWMTSHWGMGLLANDGDHGWEPGNARFTDPRSGDRVLRAQIATGPHTSAGIVGVVAGDLLDGDLLSDDDILLDGDTAQQLIVALLVGQGLPHGAGVYAVRRHQDAADGSPTDVWAFDVTARTLLTPTAGLSVGLEAEAVVITGTTELAPTSDFPEHDVLQVGAAFRATFDAGRFGSVLDVLVASGDQNIDDDQQNAFRADPNYEVGLLLFRQVMAAQSARGAATAGDLELVGVPAEDLDRIPTRGSPTDTVAVFPRLRARPADGLEIYAGPLFAFGVVPFVDPFNTRIAGGAPRNALDGQGSRYLGTELDAGIRYRLNVSGLQATLGGEVGALRPGAAFVDNAGGRMGPVVGGRLMLDARL